jgi:hypothetical protein
VGTMVAPELSPCVTSALVEPLGSPFALADYCLRLGFWAALLVPEDAFPKAKAAPQMRCKWTEQVLAVLSGTFPLQEDRNHR